MIQISPFHPEIDAIWHAVAASGARSVAVVSAETGEGTTLIAGALARRAGLSMMADKPESGRAAASSLLVDLNLGRPGVARILGLRPLPGEIVRLDALGLAVLADIGLAGADGWRERSHLRARLEAWKAEWGMVVLDTAPILAVPDTRIIAPLAHNLCLVARAEHSPKGAVRRTLQILEEDGTHISGIIFNGFVDYVIRYFRMSSKKFS